MCGLNIDDLAWNEFLNEMHINLSDKVYKIKLFLKKILIKIKINYAGFQK